MAASTFLASNNAGTTLGSAMSSSTTTMVLAAGTGANFPNPNPALGQYFAMTLIPAASSTGLPNEIVYVTARTGDTCTVLRAQEGTPAQTWSVGDSAQNLWTAGQALSLVQVSQLQSDTPNYGAEGGTANAGTVTLVPAPASLAAMTGAAVRVKKGSANTGAYTLNMNGFGAVPVVLPAGVALSASALPAGSIFTVVYDGVSRFILQSSSGVTTPAGPAGGDLTGTYPNPTIQSAAVTNAKLANMNSNTLKANLLGSAQAPQDVTLSALATALGIFTTITTNGNGTAITLPGGVIFQFGVAGGVSQNSSPVTVSFPISFPNGAFGGAAGATIAPSSFNTGTDYGATVIGTPGLSSMQISVGAYATAAPATAFSVNWYVVGH